MFDKSIYTNYRLNYQTGHFYFDDTSVFPCRKFRISFRGTAICTEVFDFARDSWQAVKFPPECSVGSVLQLKKTKSISRPFSEAAKKIPDADDRCACIWAAHSPLESFIKLLPGYAWAIACTFPGLPLRVFVSISRSSRFGDLAKSNFVLASCLLAKCMKNTGIALLDEMIEKCAGMKRTELLQFALGLDAPRLVRFLSLVQVPAGTDIEHLEKLIRGIAADNTALEFYSAYNSLPIEYLKLRECVPLLKYVKFLAPAAGTLDPLSPSYLGTEEIDAVCKAIGDSVTMANDLQRSLRDKPFKLSHCASPQDVYDLHKRLVAEYNLHLDEIDERRLIARYGTIDFPPPPFPGSETIRPICNLKDLKAEGRAMHHCVGTYSYKVMDGISYIYSVHSPQRATLELSINRTNNQWELVQMHLVCNGKPLNATFSAVAKWLDQEKMKKMRQTA